MNDDAQSEERVDGADAPADEESAGGEVEQQAPEDVEVDGHRVGDVADELDGDAADAVAALGERVAELEAELEAKDDEISELESKLKRKQADFQNYKKRAKKREDQVRERATENLVERLVDVRDNLVRALEQGEDAEIRDGVEATLAEFDRVLADENVEAIEPQPGDEVDPQRHEVMLRVESDEPEGTVADRYQPGYEMSGKVIRAAQVTVSEGPDDADEN